MNKNNLIKLLLFLSVFFVKDLLAQSTDSDTNRDDRSANTSQFPEHINELSLSKAMNLAIRFNPTLAAQKLQIEADTARMKGNEGYANPELSVDVEDFLGNRSATGADSIQVTTAVSQEVQFGHKSKSRNEVKKDQKKISTIELSIMKEQLKADVALAFLQVLTEQQKLINAEEMVSVSNKTVETVSFQVEAGRSTSMEKDKASIEYSLMLLAKEDTASSLTSAMQRLSSICGSKKIFFDHASGNLEEISALPLIDDLLKGVFKHPEILKKTAEINYSKAILSLEKSKRAPDVTFSLGHRWNNGGDYHALVAGISVPIGIIDRNQGPIGAAAKDTLIAGKEFDSKNIEIHNGVEQAFSRLAMEHKRATILKNDIYPKVLKTFLTVEEGFRMGRFGYIDLLDAQRTLFEVKNMTLDALMKYHQAAILSELAVSSEISDNRFNKTAQKERVLP